MKLQTGYRQSTKRGRKKWKAKKQVCFLKPSSLSFRSCLRLDHCVFTLHHYIICNTQTGFSLKSLTH